MAIKTERLQLRVDIDTAEGVRNLSALQEKYDLLIQKNKEAKGDDKSTTAKQALEAKAALDKERESLGLVGLTLKELKQYQRELNNEKNRYNEGTDQYNKANANLNIVKTRIKELTSAQRSYNQELLHTVKTQGAEALSLTHLREYYKLLKKEIEDTSEFESEANKKRIQDSQRTQALINEKEVAINGTSSFFSQIKNGLPSAIAGGIGGLTVGFTSSIIDVITSGFSNATKRAAELSDQTASMQKAISASEQDVQGIVKGLHGIDTRTSSKELKEIVIAAGQMGIAKEDVVGFTKAMDTLTVSLKDEFTGGGDEITKTFVPLRNIFTDIKTQKIDQDLLHIGNAINVLGQSGLATGPVIADITARIGASAAIYGVTAGQTLGLAASYQELAISSERGSTATVKIMQKIASTPAEFAKIAGMGTKEFTQLVNTDMASAFVKVAEGFAKSKGKATEFAEKLSDANISSAAISEVLAKVGQNASLVHDKMNLATTSLKGTSSIMSEFNIRNENFAAKQEKAAKVWDSWMNGLSGFVQTISEPVISAMARICAEGKTAVQVFEEQKTKTENLNATLPGLIAKYKDLTKDGDLSAEAQKNLNETMAQIANVVPGAITQWDNYGKAISVNIGLVELFQKKNEQALKLSITNAREEIKNEQKKLMADKAILLRQLNDRTQNFEVEFILGKGLVKKNVEKDYDGIRKKIADISNTLANNAQIFNNLGKDSNVETGNVTKPTGGTTGGGKPLTDKEKNERIAREKYLQESAIKEIELAAKLAFDKDQALANAENKRVQQAERTAELETKRVRNQFRDQNGIIIKEGKLTIQQKQLIADELALIDEKLNTESLAIRDEFAQKREAQILEQTNRAIQLAQNARASELQNNLKTAQRKGTSLDVFNAQEAILANNQTITLANLKVKYEKERETLKDNKDALLELEKNYGAEKSNIIAQNLIDWENLTADYLQKDFDRTKKANLEKLKLDVSEAELNGDSPNTAKIALLNAEMLAELSVANLTEEEKTNILRRYAQERMRIEKESVEITAQQAIQYFSEAFSNITNLFSQSLKSRETTQNENYNAEKQKIEELESSGTYSKAKAKSEQTKLEKKHAHEVSKIRHEQAKIEKAQNVVSATINGVQAVMKALAELGPIAGPIAGVVLGGITAANIAQIIAQPLPKVEASLFTGGALPSVFQNPLDDKGGGLILGHPDEFMIPKWIRQDPVFANIEPVIQHMIDTGRSYYNGGPVLESSRPSTITTRPNEDISPVLNLLADYLKQSISMQEEVINGVRNIQIVIGHEAAEKILDTANQTKSYKQAAAA
jgi:Phage-related minor tail protein